LKNLLQLKKIFLDFCSFNKLRGTILIAQEGINGTVAGFENSVKKFEKMIDLKGFKKIEKKYSFYKYMPFNRLKIKVKKEIITFSNINLNVQKKTAKYIEPHKWNQIINNKDILLLDVRNDFEYKLGTFEKSFNPKINNFSKFKKFVEEKLQAQKNKQIAMFCTGGIRCEKASSYMLDLGFKNLFQLKGGILKYLEEVPKKNSKWQGECFVFDNRVSVKNELKNGTYKLCHGCRVPLSTTDCKSNKYEKGVSCSKCYDKLSDEKKRRLRQRNKQIEIAKKKGIYNPYINYTTSNFF
tara:strand:+ start:127 stop:1014 length:888 start_codon:yes stop_codon:yes gene_type:complete